ncbi:NADH:ubiquinone reductase (Na(+)-transporting) subunit B [Lacihabitans sp. LS3-19]|uniref:NADH:ubiquinone reductase (Na(+)-transporting) subunit B n=1 Tax=Lacihabitans sp. LS3-19 TaxID=2487335 RepID=UPI0020CE4794|nr:NADH:ubiquinone reductase (Na(+)-transporting) subunit B [Lacihabitans sp. LS3-19]MCP9767272.1 NADH:ubiquinone reductase (Na(+)-transporting) subunit B [Lacihabitans sp. LS3-19]
MKLARKLVDSVKPKFAKGSKLEKYHYLFDAFETFLFVPDTTTKNGVHVRDAMDLKRTMLMVIIALIPSMLFGIWNTGHQHYLAFGMESSFMDNMIFGLIKVLPIIVVSYAAGLGVEFLFSITKGHPVSEGYLVTGLLIPLTLPVTVPLWMVALGAVFCTLLGKEIFGGTGMNFMNPALLARAFMFFAFPAFMSGDIWTDLSPEVGHQVVDAFSGATNLVVFDTNYASLPSAWDMFMGFEQGSIGETSVLACLIGAVILIVSGVGSWRIIVSIFVGGYLMGLLMNILAPADNLAHAMHTPAHFHWLMGSFAFGAVFMATDPVSAAQTNTGKIIYGLLIGIMIVVLRVFNPAYPEAVMLTILLLNVFAPIIDHIVVERHIKTRLKNA